MTSKTPNQELADNLEHVYCNLEKACEDLETMRKNNVAFHVKNACTNVLQAIQTLDSKRTTVNCPKE